MRRGTRSWVLLTGLAACVQIPPAVELSELLVSQRFQVARISGAAHSPCQVLLTEARSDFPAPTSDALFARYGCASLPVPGTRAFRRLAALEAQVRDQLRIARPDGQSLRAIALLDLALAGENPEAYDRAASALGRALQLPQADSATILADLAAVALTRGSQLGIALDVVRALDLSEQALQQSPEQAAAGFNRALALEWLGFSERARHAWTGAWDSGRPDAWSREAEEHLHQLGATPPEPADWLTVSEEPPTSSRWLSVANESDPGTTRLRVVEHVLPGWAEAETAGDAQTAQSLLELAMRLATAGQEVATRGGFEGAPLAASAVRQIEDTAPSQRRRTAAGFVEMGRAAGLYAEGGFQRSREHWIRAAEILDEVGNPAGAHASLYVGVTSLYDGDTVEAERVFETTRIAAVAAGLPSVEAFAWWGLGLTAIRSGQPGSAAEAYQHAFSLYDRIGEQEHRGAIEFLLAEANEILGRSAQADTWIVRALRTLGRFPTSVRLHNHLHFISRTWADRELIRAAVVAQAEGVAVASKVGRRQHLPEALTGLARARVRAGLEGPAREALEAAQREVERVADAGMHARLRADLVRAEAELLARRQPSEALPRFDSTLVYFRSVGIRPPLLEVLLSRADVHGQLHDSKGRAADLQEALDVIEGGLADLQNPVSRAGLIEHVDRTYDALVQVLVDEGRSDEALEYLERGRALTETRGLADMSSPADDSPPILAYAVLDDALCIWLLNGSERRFVRVSVDVDELRSRVEAFVSALRWDRAGSEWPELARSLYRDLLGPVEAMLPDSGLVTIVPDDILHTLPISALVSPESGQPALGRWTFRFASSIASARAARAPRAVDTGRAPLVVGNPSFDRGAHPQLPTLVAADAESRSVRSAWAEVTGLQGADATPSRVRQALVGRSLIHFAGHAQFDPVDANRSRLILAPDNTGQDVLTALEIREVAMDAAVVVLSACSTSGASGRKSSGVTGLADAFLAAGATVVVGSLWPVEDAATAALMAEFHRALAAGSSPTAALRGVQLGFARSGDPSLSWPGAWAPFQVLTGAR